MMAKSGQRFEQLDGLRGVAALLVALFHLPILHAGVGTTFLNNAYLMVDFFFVLSGFVLMHSYGEKLKNTKKFGVFVIRRFGRLWPLHAVMLLVLIGFESLKWYVQANHGVTFSTPVFAERSEPSAIFAHLAFLNAFGLFERLTWNSPSWSIGAEFYTYLLFGVCVLLFKQSLKPAVLFMLLGGFSVYLLAPRGMDSSYDFGFMRCLMGFFAGVITYRLKLWWEEQWHYAIKPSPWYDIALLTCAVLFVGFAGVHTAYLAPLMFMAVVLVLSLYPGYGAKVLQYPIFQALGAWSYGIYLIHSVVILVMMFVLSAAKGLLPSVSNIDVMVYGEAKLYVSYGMLTDTLILMVYFGIVIITAALAYRMIEKPAQHGFNQVAKRVTARSW